MWLSEERKRKVATAWLCALLALVLTVGAALIATAAARADPLAPASHAHPATWGGGWINDSASCEVFGGCTTGSLTIPSGGGVLVLISGDGTLSSLLDSSSSSFTELEGSYPAPVSVCDNTGGVGTDTIVLDVYTAQPTAGPDTFTVADSGRESLYVAVFNSSFSVSTASLGGCATSTSGTPVYSAANSAPGDFVGAVGGINDFSIPASDWAAEGAETVIGDGFKSWGYADTTNAAYLNASGSSTNVGFDPDGDTSAAAVLAVDVPLVYVPTFSCTIESDWLGFGAVEGSFHVYVNVTLGTSPYQYNVSWGDSTNNSTVISAADSITPSHTYSNAEILANSEYLTVTATVFDVTPAETAPCSLVVNAYEPTTLSAISHLPTNPTANASTYWSVTYTSQVGVYAWGWSWGDGTYENETYENETNSSMAVLSTGHFYTVPGTYTVHLWVEDWPGYNHTVSASVTVGHANTSIGPPPIPRCGVSSPCPVSTTTETYLALGLVVVIVIVLLAMLSGSRRD